MKIGSTKRSRLIRQYLLDNIKSKNANLFHDAMEVFGITRQSVHSHLTALVDIGLLVAEGNTRGRTYRLGVNRLHRGIFQLAGLQESDVYLRDFNAVFTDLPKEVESICHYGFTEMLNNAIDHSVGKQVEIIVKRGAQKISIQISDDGEGIFNHIFRLMSLQDPREALLELSKGKLTTDPDNHTGQGIFFTSRAFDQYAIFSGDLVFTHHDANARDFLLHSDSIHDGTTVYMEVLIDTSRKIKDVFDEFTGNIDEDFAFNKTVVPVKLALYEGDTLVSRSQAKRIMNRVEKFKTVILDFREVGSIGQAFADEVFRVFAKRNPQIEIHTANENEDVKKMILAAQNYVE